MVRRPETKSFCYDGKRVFWKNSCCLSGNLLNRRQLRKALVINRPLIWFAGWSTAAMRLLLPSVTFGQVAGVVNFFLIHKFRGLEIGGSYGNTNLGASNEMGEWQAWLKAGTGDDKTDIVVITDFWQRTGGLFSRDRDISSNAFQIPWGGFDARSANESGRVPGFRLIPNLFFSANSPPPHSPPNVQTSPFYKNPYGMPPTRYPVPPNNET